MSVGGLLLLIGFPVLSFAAPHVLYTDILSGPNTGGENNNGAYLTLFGNGFGASRGTSTVTVGGGEVAAYKYWSDTKVSVQIGPAASSGSIVLAAPEGTGTAPQPFNVRPGNFYFVSLSGSDSSGAVNNINRPFRTPNYLKDSGLLRPGDFIVVRGGTYVLDDGTHNIYNGSWLRPIQSGTAASPYTFMGYPGEVVTAQTDRTSVKVFAHGETISHWVVANFYVFVNNCANGNVLSIGIPASSAVCTVPNSESRASYIRVVNFEVDGQDRGGLCSGGSGDNVIVIANSDHVTLLGASIHNTGTAGGTSEPSHLIYLSATQNDTEVGWSHIHHIPHSRAIIQVHQDSFGGSCWGWKAITDITLHDNRIHDVAGQAILLDGGTGNVSIYNNVIYNTPLADDHRYNDIIALRGSGGMLNAKLYNNTVYANPNYTGAGYILGIGFNSHCPEALTFYNNIFGVAEGQDIYYQTDCGSVPISSNNNIWYGSSGGMPSFSGSAELNADPLFVDALIGNFQLTKTTTQTSPAIDKGLSSSPVNVVVAKDFNGSPRPQGLAYDIGAIESTGATLSTPQNVQLRKK
jgi:hypothetical protein